MIAHYYKFHFRKTLSNGKSKNDNLDANVFYFQIKWHALLTVSLQESSHS